MLKIIILFIIAFSAHADYFKQFKTTPQVIEPNVVVKLDINGTEANDTAGQWSPPDQRLTLAANGCWAMSAAVFWSGEHPTNPIVDGQALELHIVKNGLIGDADAYIASNHVAASGHGAQSNSISTIACGVAGDFFEVFVYQNTGPLYINDWWRSETWFNATKIK